MDSRSSGQPQSDSPVAFADASRCARSLAWLVGYRRLQVRYERRADILLAFLYLAWR